MYNYTDIKSIQLEVTQNCQDNCPMCDRNMNGEGLNPHINLDELSLEDCKNIFTKEFIAQLDTMYMCGNLGDPIVAKDTLEIFKYFREHNPNMWLSMNTNAGAKNETATDSTGLSSRTEAILDRDVLRVADALRDVRRAQAG